MMCRQYVLSRATSGTTSGTTVTSITNIFGTGIQLGSIGTMETATDDVQTICRKQGHIRNHIKNHSDINN